MIKFYCSYSYLREYDGTFPMGTPYYIGKGNKYRPFSVKGHRISVPKNRACIIVQEYISEKEALEAERFLVTYYGRVDLGTGCLRNFTDGGEGPFNLSEEGRRRISVRLMGHVIAEETKIKISSTLKGIKHTPERKLIQSNAQMGSKHSEETRRKIGEGNKGKTRSEETLRRMSESKKGHITSEETKRKLREIAKINGPNSSAFKKGHKSSEETLSKMRAAHKNRLPISEETRAKMSASNKGKNKGRKLTPEQSRRKSEAQRGKKHKSHNVEALIRRNIAQTKTHCLRGHPRTPDNVGASYGCKACKILLQKIRKGRKHGDTVQV